MKKSEGTTIVVGITKKELKKLSKRFGLDGPAALIQHAIEVGLTELARREEATGQPTIGFKL